jgi:hypothetical protein
MVAQDMQSDAVMPAPKVLVIEREYVKPGRSGAIHEKSEAAFVNAAKAANWPTHYVALTSMSGRSRALFLMGFPSFEAWEKDNQAAEKNVALSTAFDKAALNDGELLSDFDQGVFTLDSENSLRAGDAVHSHYLEISSYRVKPGHRKDWMELVKIYHDAFEKAAPDVHWALYESYYGADNGGLYVVISTMKSLAEDDAGMGDGKKLEAALGPDGMKHVAELTAACVDSQQSNLFQISPKMSYPAAEWIKADSFWAPKMETAGMKKPAGASQKTESAAMKKPAAANQ